jgi:hypothetical protein
MDLSIGIGLPFVNMCLGKFTCFLCRDCVEKFYILFRIHRAGSPLQYLRKHWLLLGHLSCLARISYRVLMADWHRSYFRGVLQ